MGDDFVDRLEEEVPEWVQDDLVSQEQGDRILERYRGPSAGRGAAGVLPGDGFEAALYGTAAVLAGAAAIAFVLVGLDPPDPGGLLVASGLALAGLGAALHLVDAEADRVADVLLAAALVPLAAAALPFVDESWLVRLPALAGPVVLLAWRGDRSWVRTLSVVAFPVAAAGTGAAQFEGHETGVWFFLVLQVALVAGLVARDRVAGQDRPVAVGLGVGGLAVAVGLFLELVVEVGGSEQLELALGAAMLAVIAIGLALAHRGLVAGGGVILAGDAVVFAFDVGGTFGGTLLLLALALVLIWQAEALRKAVG